MWKQLENMAQYNFVNPSPAYLLSDFHETHFALACNFSTCFLRGLRSRFEDL
jgi:hypothetical protein